MSTRNEKASLMSWMQPWQLPMPVSTDGLGQADRQHLLWGYAGILWQIDPSIVYFTAQTSGIAMAIQTVHPVVDQIEIQTLHPSVILCL